MSWIMPSARRRASSEGGFATTARSAAAVAGQCSLRSAVARSRVAKLLLSRSAIRAFTRDGSRRAAGVSWAANNSTMLPGSARNRPCAENPVRASELVRAFHASARVPLTGLRGGRTSQPRTTVSSPPENSRPSGPNARAVTRSRCPRNSARTFHVAVSQRRITPSADAVARVRPSGANAAFVAPGRGPAARVATARPVAASQT